MFKNFKPVAFNDVVTSTLGRFSHVSDYSLLVRTLLHKSSPSRMLNVGDYAHFSLFRFLRDLHGNGILTGSVVTDNAGNMGVLVYVDGDNKRICGRPCKPYDHNTPAIVQMSNVENQFPIRLGEVKLLMAQG